METPSSRYLKEMSNGNRNFEIKVFNLLLNELPKEYNTYQKAIRTKNYYWAFEIVRKINHKIILFEMWEAQSLLEKHEEALITGELKYHKEFQNIINRLLKFSPEKAD